MLIFLEAISFGEIGQSLNIGIKIGYDFGDGLIEGVEISYVFINSNYSYFGPVIGISKNTSLNYVTPYIETEIGYGPVGTAVGFEWKNNLLFEMRFFGGAFAFASYSICPQDGSKELSGVLKIPIILKEPKFPGIMSPLNIM